MDCVICVGRLGVSTPCRAASHDISCRHMVPVPQLQTSLLLSFKTVSQHKTTKPPSSPLISAFMGGISFPTTDRAGSAAVV